MPRPELRPAAEVPLDASRRWSILLTLAAPIVVGQASTVMASFADTWMLSRLGSGDEQPALAALGAGATTFLVAFLVFTSLSQGVQILTARRVGEGRRSRTGEVLSAGLRSGLALAAIAAATGWVLPDLICPLMTEDAETARLAAEYLHYRWGLGLPFACLAFCFRGFLWGVQRTRVDLAVSLAYNLFNLGFDWLLIFGKLGFPEMGIGGAGLASALANMLSALIFLAVTLRPAMRRRYGLWPRRRLTPDLGWRVFRLSAPRAVQAAAMLMTVLFFRLVRDAAGDNGLAVSSVVWRFLGLTVLVAIGFGTATSTLVSRSLGEGRTDLARVFARTGVLAGAGVVLAIIIPLAIWREAALGAFLTPGSPLVALAMPAFFAMLGSQVIDASGIILSRALTGAGDVRFVMYAEYAISFGVCLPAAWLGAHLLADTLPLLGVWLGWVAYVTAWTTTMALRWRSNRWTHARV